MKDFPTATVITSSIGRPELKACIESVRAQTHPVKHFVFVNGPRFHDAARETLKEYPEVHAFYLPEETGDYGAGPSMADVFAAAPFLTRSDWIFYLDDDNFYEPNHVESLLALAQANDLKWAYSLRSIVDITGKHICHDDWCSLGHWPMHGIAGTHLVDNSCYAISRPLALRIATAWTALPVIADRCVFMALKESGTRYGCTGLSTVNYRAGTGSADDDRDGYIRIAEETRAKMPNGFPWRTAQVFGHDIQP